MVDNQTELNIGLEWPIQDDGVLSLQAELTWDLTQTQNDWQSKLVSQAVSIVKKNNYLEKNRLTKGRLTLEGNVLFDVLNEWSYCFDDVLNSKSKSAHAKVLQLVVSVFVLAQRIVDARDLIAAAFIKSFSVDRRLNMLRETATTTDDVMPSWAAGNGQFVGFWIPSWSVPQLLSVRQSIVTDTFVSSDVMVHMLPEQRINAVDWLIISSVDALVRAQSFDVRDVSEASTKSYRVMYRGESDVFQSWRDALSGFESQIFSADGWLVARSMRQALQKSGWMTGVLDDLSGRQFYSLSFHLLPPSETSTSADWHLVYQVRHRYFGWTKPFMEWWSVSERVWRIGADTLISPDVWMLPMLREASAASTFIEQSLQMPCPSYCVIPADDVYMFLTESVPRLREMGFGIETPNVLRGDLSKIRVRMRVKRPRAESRRNRGTGPQWFNANQLVDFDWSVVIENEEISHELFTQMVTNQTPFIQVGGSWRLVPVDEILRQLDQFGGAQSSQAGILDLSRAMLMSRDESDVHIDMEYDDEALPVEEVICVMQEATHPLQLDAPASFCGELRHYQQFGYSWLMHLRTIGCGACLADDMGLGKTVQVLAYLLRLKETNETRNIHLLVCPTSLLPNWRAELARFAPSLSVYVHHGPTRDVEGYLDGNVTIDLVMTTYATLVRDMEILGQYDFDAVIVDEAQNVKNVDTKQARAIRGIRASHRIALTGTPMENRLEELWSLMDFLNRGFLGSMSWFRKTFADPAQRDPSGIEASKLQVLLRPVLLRRRKSDPNIQTELPDKWEVDERTFLTSEQAAIYQAMVNELFSEIEPLSRDAMSRRGQILATLVRLKQVCDHPSLVSGGAPAVRRSGKLRQLMDRLQTVIDEGDSALIFTQFRDMGEILCDAIEEQWSIRPKFLHGGLSANARGKMVDDFQSEADPSSILVLSLRAGGVGINLTRANHVFHFDRWWNPAVEDQATDRAYRIGQTRDVQVHKMICTGTLEERINDLITSKRQLSQAIVGGSSEWVTELDNDALYALFSLSEQSVWEEDEV